MYLCFTKKQSLCRLNLTSFTSKLISWRQKPLKKGGKLWLYNVSFLAESQHSTGCNGNYFTLPSVFINRIPTRAELSQEIAFSILGGTLIYFLKYILGYVAVVFQMNSFLLLMTPIAFDFYCRYLSVKKSQRVDYISWIFSSRNNWLAKSNLFLFSTTSHFPSVLLIS